MFKGTNNLHQQVRQSWIYCNNIARSGGVGEPSFIPHIKWVMSKCNTIAALSFQESISISKYIDGLTFYFLTFKAGTITSLDLQTSRYATLCILIRKIYWVNGITVMIQHYNYQDAFLVQNARWVENRCEHCNWFENIWFKETEHHEAMVSTVNKDIPLQNCYRLFVFLIESILGKPIQLAVWYRRWYLTTNWS